MTYDSRFTFYRRACALFRGLGLAGLGLALLPSVRADSTIDAVNQFAYGANIGWLNWRGDTSNGAVIGEYVCSGYIYSANVGWIHLGSGVPVNGIQYQNNSGNDFGVNHDGLGNLRGYAYGGNIGWLNFEDTGAPQVDLLTGNLSGHVWSGNCGWISLSNATAFVQTGSIRQGDLATSGMPVAWLLTWFGNIDIDRNADPDGDGMSNLQEYLAGTNPTNATDVLRITGFQRGNFGNPTRVDLTWTSKPTRFYAVQYTSALDTPFADWFALPFPGADNGALIDTNPRDFYRIRAFRPLTP